LDAVIYSLLLLVGFVLVIKGADFTVSGATHLAKKFGISELTIGLTVVAFGTSAPELAVNVLADDEIVFGNVVGSNNFNLLAILGIAGLMSPMLVRRKTIFIELPYTIIILGLLLLLLNDGLFGHAENILSRFDAIILLIGFVLFMAYAFKTSKQELVAEVESGKPKPLPLSIGLLLLGLAGLVFGGHLVVENASGLARLAHVSETVIGLTIVSLGTSLPELATSVAAARKGKADIAVGNVVGSNLFNVLLILGVSSLIKNRHFNADLNADITLTLVATAFLFLVLLIKPHKRISSYESVVLFGGFIIYFIYIFNREMNWF